MSSVSDRLAAALADRYRIERELGAGGMATVYLAQDLKHDRLVAIKVLREELSASLGKERFLREIKVAAGLQHPHVLPLYDSGEAEGLLFYVMPYVNGLSLRERLVKEGELPINDAVRILRDLADALSEAHRNGVVHRDLKPENVMLRGRHALVTDFGVAKALSEATGRQSLTTLGVALGTPTYMAPEQAVADPNVDHRADLYAFGVVAYELLTGRPPFSGLSPQQILAAHVTAAVEPLTNRRSVPPALAALVMQCLEKNPADRPQSADAIIVQLEAALTPSGGMTPTETAPHRALTSSASPSTAPGGTASRAPALRWAVGALGFILVAAFAWMRFGGEETAAAVADATQGQIAVLPFENIGNDTANAYFADGMTDELATVLAKVPALRVASRTSSYAFRDVASRDVGVIRSVLKAGTILEGTVSRSGNQVRISARLTNTADGVEIWSDAFVREASDVFAVQNEVARAIVRALVPTLPGQAVATQPDTSRGTGDPVAYDLLLRARHLWYQRGLVSLRQSVALFREATERDSTFARAFAGLAVAMATLSDYEDSVSPTRVAEVERAAARAIALDSTLAEPHVALGYLWNRVLRAAESERAFQRAIALDPRSSTAHQWYGSLLWSMGRDADAVVQATLSAELDPLSAIIAANLARGLSIVGRKEEALATADRAKTLDPRNALVFVNIAFVHGRVGQHVESLAAATDAQRLGAPPSVMIRYAVAARAALGDSSAARAELQRAISAMGPRARHSINVAAAYAALGDRERALATLRRAVEARDYGLTFAGALRADPVWAPFLDDPEFRASVQQIEVAP